MFLASTGIRIRAILGLKLRDLVAIDRCDLYHVTVYSDSKDYYIVYTTPETTAALNVYFSYNSPIFAITKGVNDLYILAGKWGNAIPKPSGPFIAKVNGGDLMQLWRTELINVNTTTYPVSTWNYIGGLNVLPDTCANLQNLVLLFC